MRMRVGALFLAAFACTAALVRCFDEPDYTGLACNADSPCPEGFLCNAESECARDCRLTGDCTEPTYDCTVSSDCGAPGPCEVLDDRVACVGGRCRYAPQVCDQPPAGECLDGDTKYRSYSGLGQCDAKSGACTYAEVVVDCLDCQASCLLRCEGLSCNESHGGCRSEGHCLPDDPPRCEYVDRPDATPCDLGNAGGGGSDGVCSAGECVACLEDANCDDRNACTSDVCQTETSTCTHEALPVECDVAPGDCYRAPGSCDPLDGACAFEAQPDGTDCDDQNLCTTTDACSDGDCLGGAQVDCDDGNPCTDDGCDPAAGCTRANNTAPCDDQDACTSGDACTEGGCAPGAAVDCDDGNPCTVDSCDPATGCARMPLPDGTECTFAGGSMMGVCGGGSCVGCTLAEHCDDGNACTTEVCNAGNCEYSNSTAVCDDGDACTFSDRCAAGVCSGTAVTCTSNQCVTRSCNGTATCSETIRNGQPCADDGNACTTDVCNASGACTHPGRADGASCGGAASNRCCGGSCVNISTSEAHCGGCNSGCDSGFTCESVSVTNTCSQRPADTSGRCRCNANSQCPRGQICRNVAPFTNRCTPPAAGNCAGGQTLVGLSGCPDFCRY